MVFFVVVSTASVRAGLQLFLKLGPGRAYAPQGARGWNVTLLVSASSATHRCSEIARHLALHLKHSSPAGAL